MSCAPTSFITDTQKRTALQIIDRRYKPHTAILPAFFAGATHALLAVIEDPRSPHALPLPLATPSRIRARTLEASPSVHGAPPKPVHIVPVAVLLESLSAPASELTITPAPGRAAPTETFDAITPQVRRFASAFFDGAEIDALTTARYADFALAVTLHTHPHISTDPLLPTLHYTASCAILTDASLSALDTSPIVAEHAFDIEPQRLSDTPVPRTWY